eukprot:Skav212271  [mRNA]  locus=scaffold732:172118:173236:- [translate_table: standard]
MRLSNAKVLHPNQNMTARVISFKEEIVEEICCVAPVLLRAQSFEALEQLLPRAMSFVRPVLDKFDKDVSAWKKLLKLCLLRTLMPNKGEPCEDAKQFVHRMLDGCAEGEIRRLVDGLEEPEIRSLTSELQYPLLHKLRNEMKASGDLWRLCIDQELVCRLATLSDQGCNWSFHRLWQLVVENCKAETWQQATQRDDWIKAAGIVLATCAGKVTHLEDLDSEVLGHAYRFLDNRQCAVDFAWYFFKYDFWIMREAVWPPASAARIFMEVASRGIAEEGKLQLLFRAHNMRDSDALVRKALLEQLHCRMLESDTAAANTVENADAAGTGTDSSPNIDVEELFLKLISEDGSQIPADVASQLAGKDAHLHEDSSD